MMSLVKGLHSSILFHTKEELYGKAHFYVRSRCTKSINTCYHLHLTLYTLTAKFTIATVFHIRSFHNNWMHWSVLVWSATQTVCLYLKGQSKSIKKVTYFYTAFKCKFLEVAADVEMVVGVIVFVAVVTGFRGAAKLLIFLWVKTINVLPMSCKNNSDPPLQ